MSTTTSPGWAPRWNLGARPARATGGLGMAITIVIGLIGLALASLKIPIGGPWVFLATVVLALGMAMTFVGQRPPLPIREVILGLHYLFYILPMVFMEYFPPPSSVGDGGMPPNVAATLRAASLGLTSLAAGLYLPVFLLWRPRLRWAGRLHAAAAGGGRIRTVFWMIWLVGFGASLLLRLPLGPVRSMVVTISELQVAAILGGYSLKFGQPDSRRWWAPHLWTLLMVFRVTVLSAFMTGTILLALGIGVIYVFRRGRIPWLAIAAVCIMAITWQTIKPMFRHVAWGQRSLGVVGRLAVLWDLTQEQGIQIGPRTRTQPLTALAMRLNQSYFLGRMIVWTPSRAAFAQGQTIEDAIEHVVSPRFLFEEKKSVGGSSNLVTKYAGIEVARGTSVGVGYLCEWYLNFGVPGIGIGMFLTGMIFQAVYRIARAAGLQGHLVLALILYVIWPALNIQGNLAEMLGGIVQRLVFSGLVVALVFATAPQVRSRAGGWSP